MQFLKDLRTLQYETGEIKIGKAIASIMKHEKSPLRMEDILVMK